MTEPILARLQSSCNVPWTSVATTFGQKERRIKVLVAKSGTGFHIQLNEWTPPRALHVGDVFLAQYR